jgi:hypothetical protein
MADINFGKSVTLKQAAALILAVPENRFLLQGEPGVGKSSLLAYLADTLPGHNPSYIDVPNMDLGDIAMPVVDHDTRVTRYYPNARFRLHEGKPVIVMLDEFTKGADPVKNMLHPLLEVANPRLGDISIDARSIIFLTGNLSSDGVGDNMKAHTRNRIVPITVRKPDADEWLAWAVSHGIDPVVMAWVRQFPHALASYLDDGQTDNPYIYSPKKVQTAFVSPRSLERASNIIKVRDQFDSDSLIAALSGAIGESAARDMQAFIAYQDQLPSWDSILASPTTAKVPSSPGACAVLVYGAISKVDRANFSKVMEYLKRFDAEWQATFAISIAKNPERYAIAASDRAFRDWALENADIL